MTRYYIFRAWVPQRLGWWLFTRMCCGYFVGTYRVVRWALTHEDPRR